MPEWNYLYLYWFRNVDFLHFKKLYSSSVGDVFSITTFNESEELSDLKIKYKKLNHEIERLQEHIFFLEQQLLLCSYPQKNKYTQDTQSSGK